MRASAQPAPSGAQLASSKHRINAAAAAVGGVGQLAATNPSVAPARSRRVSSGSALRALSPGSSQGSRDTIKTNAALSRRPQTLGALSIRLQRRNSSKPPTPTTTLSMSTPSTAAVAAAATTSADAKASSSSSSSPSPPAPRRTAGRAASLGDPQAKPAPRGAAARRAKEEATAAAAGDDAKPSPTPKGRGRGRTSSSSSSSNAASPPVPRGASAAQLARRAPAWMRLDEAEIERQRAELAADREARRSGRAASGDLAGAAAAPVLLEGSGDPSRPRPGASTLAARRRAAKAQHAGSAKRALEAARRAEREAEEARRLMSREGGTKPDFSAHAHPTREQWWAVEVPCSDARKASSVARWLEAAPRRIPKLEKKSSDGSDIERVVTCYVPKKQVRAWSFRANKMGSRKVAFRDGAVVFFRAVMDQHLGEYVASSIIDVSSYDERKETAGRISGYHKKVMFPGSQKNQVPLPLCFADDGGGEGGEAESELLREAREWEVTEEIWDRATSWEHENPGTPLPPLPSDDDEIDGLAGGVSADVGAGAGKGAGLAAARAELAKAAQQQQREKEQALSSSSPSLPSSSTYLPAVRGRARETLEKAAYSEEARLAGFAKRVAEASRAAEAASAAAAGWNVGPPPPSSSSSPSSQARGGRGGGGGGGGDRFYDDNDGFYGRGERKEYAPRGGARGRGGVSSRGAEPSRTPRFGSSSRGVGGGGGWASNNGEDDGGDFRSSSSSSSYHDDDDDAFGVGGAWGNAAGGAAGDESDGFGWRPSSSSSSSSDAAAGSWLDDDGGGGSDFSPSSPSPSSSSSSSKPRKGSRAAARDPIAATASRDAGSSADEDAWASEDGGTLAGEFLKEEGTPSSFDAGAVAARDYYESDAAAGEDAGGSWATSSSSSAQKSDGDDDVEGQEDPSSWFDEGLEWE